MTATFDTKTVANLLGTEARILRRFLRDKRSTFQAVGSGSRYEFTETDIAELSRRFNDWLGTKANARPISLKRAVVTDPQAERLAKDQKVWDEEGPIFFEDMRDPRVRRAVQERARAQENRLMARLMAAGLHISQMRDRELSAA